MASTIEEALRELNEGRSREYPWLSGLKQLVRLYDFLYYDKKLSAYLVDSNFHQLDQHDFSDQNHNIVKDINRQYADRELVVLRYLGKIVDDTPSKNLYAALDIDTFGNKGIINIYGWTVGGSSRSLSEFKQYLKEFYEKEGYSPEAISQNIELLEPSSPAVKSIRSKNWGNILNITFSLKEPAPREFKRRKSN